MDSLLWSLEDLAERTSGRPLSRLLAGVPPPLTPGNNPFHALGLKLRLIKPGVASGQGLGTRACKA